MSNSASHSADQPANQPLQDEIRNLRQQVHLAREGGQKPALALALASLSLALFQARSYEDGLANFDEAEKLAAETDDWQLQARCFGIKAAAYQEAKRYPDGYEAISQMLRLAELHSDQALQCDALIGQAQMLIDSGEPMLAEPRLRQARTLADALNDRRRQMTALGTLGNLALARALLPEALGYCEEALGLAVALEDRHAEMGFLTNVGTVLAWLEQHARSAATFQRLLALSTEQAHPTGQLTALRYLTENLVKSGQPESALEYGQRAIALARELDDPNAALAVYPTVALACYYLNRVETAHHWLREAVACARAAQDLEKELNLLLNLGESYMAQEQHAEALPIYEQALEGAVRLERRTDEAYLVGRLGAVCAGLGQLERAISYHQRAVELAQQRMLPELEGDQFSMLALAYLDLNQPDEARKCCRRAITIYAAAGLREQEANAHNLLMQIAAPNQNVLDSLDQAGQAG